MKKDKEASFIQ